MLSTHLDRRKPTEEVVEIAVRPHDRSTIVKAALELQQGGSGDEARELLLESGFTEEEAARILLRGDYREGDAAPA